MCRRTFNSRDGRSLEIRQIPSEDSLLANVFDGNIALVPDGYTFDIDFLIDHSIDEFFDLIQAEWQ